MGVLVVVDGMRRVRLEVYQHGVPSVGWQWRVSCAEIKPGHSMGIGLVNVIMPILVIKRKCVQLFTESGKKRDVPSRQRPSRITSGLRNAWRIPVAIPQIDDEPKKNPASETGKR